MATSSSFKLTYATMFNPPEELHVQFEQALNHLKANLGQEHGMLIAGKERYSAEKVEDRSPANTDLILGVFQKGTAKDANDAVAAARSAFPAWSHTKWQERVALIRKVADLMDQRIYDIGAVMAMEVGKNRMEALGDAAETADLFRYACTQMEANDGYIRELGREPLVSYISTNTSVMRPYGVWVVISPFNFPASLTGGPVGSALVAGNTVVIKPASDTPWTARLIAEYLRDAGVPDGVFNFVTGPGGSLGQALIENPDIDGITFTGSYDVGMKIYCDFCGNRYVRPIILELGGKNPTIVSRHADLDTAVTGIVRSAFGLQGQKCSANSRVFIEEPIYDALLEKLVAATQKLTIGDPTDRQITLGPVINHNSYRDYQTFTEELSQSGRILTGGKILTDGAYAKGYFVAPTLVADLPLEHRLWKQEMFVPITTLAKISSLEEGMEFANDVTYGLTAGFYGTPQECEWFFDQIQAGVTYVNRPQGSTTGAWPGFQPFGGWKGSGSTGKNSGGLYYLPLYMHEQIRTMVRKA
ncbi:MAG TPA: aldehyde dehydrogenase family protein [Anaerolineaceae bacterium]|nr:aldehyde dehydrogenase family protein [Anaerolineaceae bacterium]